MQHIVPVKKWNSLERNSYAGQERHLVDNILAGQVGAFSHPLTQAVRI